MDQAKLIIFSAPSGAGKSSLIRKLIELGEKSIELSVSATTRLPREGEVHGKDYFFISDDEFNQMRENAKKYSQTTENEAIRLISHGLFHCLGYKDKSNNEKEIMRKKEEEFIFAVSRETKLDV